MDQLAHGRFVTSSLMAALTAVRGRELSDRLKDMGWDAMSKVATLLGVMVMIVLEVVRALTANNANTYDLGQIKDQIRELRQLEQNQNNDLSDKINKLQDQLNNGPRPADLSDKFLTIERHLSALDGRMDGMDTRLRGDETDLTRAQTKIDGIDQASRAQLLPGRK